PLEVEVNNGGEALYDCGPPMD
ncbi:MAG: hypothetical protein QOJ50_2382, partial [Cryptosporangiaceae bacterium]|nr:hypothetical protein [Cryptosporangiaceae bacterium]